MRNKKIEIKIKKTNKKTKDIPKESLKKGPKVCDIKLNKDKTQSINRPISSRIIQIKEEKEDSRKASKGNYFIGLGILVLFLIAGVIFYFYFWGYRPQMAKLIPKEAVVYSEINLDKILNEKEPEKTIHLVSKFLNYEDFLSSLKENINRLVLEKYGLDFERDVKDILGKKLAFGFLPEESESKNRKYSGFIILQISNKEKLNEVLSRISKSSQKEIKPFRSSQINSFHFDDPGQNFYCLLIDDILVLSKSDKVIEEIISIHQNQKKSLAGFSEFKKVFRHFPQNSLFYFYTKTSDLPDNLFGLDRYLNKTADYFTPLVISLQKFENFGLSLGLENEGVVFDAFTSHQTEGSSNLVELVKELPRKTVISFSGYNLKKKFLEFQEDLNNKDPLAGFYLANLEKRIKDQYNLNIAEDLYPLLENEFQFVLLPKEGNKINFLIALKLDNPSLAREKMKKVEGAIIDYFSQINPKEQEMKLSDGSKATELLPDKNSLAFEDFKYEDTTIRSLKSPKTDFQVSYLITKDRLFFSTFQQPIKDIISSHQGLFDERNFNRTYKKVSKGKTETIIYTNFSSLLSYLGYPEKTKNYLSPLKNLIITFSEADKGTKGSGFILIK